MKYVVLQCKQIRSCFRHDLDVARLARKMLTYSLKMGSSNKLELNNVHTTAPHVCMWYHRVYVLHTTLSQLETTNRLSQASTLNIDSFP